VASIVVTGAGVGGLLSAMLLADDGHEVVVLERDPAPPPAPGEAWDAWARRGVNQFRLLHFFQPRFRLEAERALPRVLRAMEAAGALSLNVVAGVPEQVSGGARPGDEDFTSVTARRPVAESVLAACAEATPGVTIRRGVVVAGLTTGASVGAGIPHVTGVRTEDGEKIPADLVVDATGRRSPLPSWLAAAEARPPLEEVEDSGFVYYGRHFRSSDGSHPPIIGPLAQPYGTVSTLTLPADNGTWGVGLITSAADRAMRAVREVDVWTKAVRSLPLAAHWLEGEPLEDGIAIMAKIEDRHRRYVVEGQPVATGVVAVADSWACTNPSLGRGISIGMIHALALRQLLRADHDPLAFALAWDEATLSAVEPWYRDTVTLDRHRLAQIDSLVAGTPYRPEDPAWHVWNCLADSAGKDPDCLRALLSIAGLLRTAEEVLGSPGLLDKVLELGAGWAEAPALGPSRDELLAIVAA
jgi:2-polyprenyl-6-methoxyphenol hydroxylase-like FAD-dependent oxidoreductase